MLTTGIIGIAILVALVVLFLVWRTVKAFVKLALVGLVALLVVAALVWWNYFGGAQDSTPSTNRPAANTRRTTTTTNR